MHVTYDDENGNAIAYIHPASSESIKTVLEAKEGSDDGRSEYVWLRLVNWDLILGVFPRGDTYMNVEEDAAFPYDKVQK